MQEGCLTGRVVAFRFHLIPSSILFIPTSSLHLVLWDAVMLGGHLNSVFKDYQLP